ncbi:PilW family protein [Ectothiorhodospira marina]|uniref:Type IV pilus assembly protein PilW n=1 Tax=Ectothiorhodospira marina TaxID=1396821 RepID=A0A1H7RA00_9GAMM|nr:PilW family protein [Ectothiorhodospira marina]SEL57013.1 type IV pilus assembly protein PilW [Ectothiorhodospira marina]
MNRSHSSPIPCRLAGFSLVELMIAIVLGLLVIAGAGTVFLTNQQAYRTNEALSQIQESSRIAFELIAMDVRQAGASACGRMEKVANVLADKSARAWTDSIGIQGFDGGQASADAPFGTGVSDRVNGTDALRVQGMDETGLSVEEHKATSAQFKTSETNDFRPGEILMVCDLEIASIFQVTGPNNPGTQNVEVVHNTGSSVTPGNCSKGLGYPTECTTNGTPWEYGSNSIIARLKDHLWYIGHNGRANEGGRSLYRYSLRYGTEEIVSGVEDMQVHFKLPDVAAWQTASAITSAADWKRVEAVQIQFTLVSAADNVSTDTNAAEGRLRRQLTHVVALRNRLK